MQQSSKRITADMIKALRDRTGAGMHECSNALKRCNGDELLAEGWLKYYGCAINTYDKPHEQWAMECAEGYKRRVLADPSERILAHIPTDPNCP